MKKKKSRCSASDLTKGKYYKEDLDTTISTKYDRPDKIIEINEKLPLFPSYSVVVAESTSGKTLTIINLLWMICHAFGNGDRIFFFTNNACKTVVDNIEKMSGNLYTSLYDTNGASRLQKIIDFQMERKLSD